MTKKELIILNMIIICAVVIVILATVREFSNADNIFNNIFLNLKQKENIDIIYPGMHNCTDIKKNNIIDSEDINIIKLNEYQDICNSFFTDNIMLFTVFPSDVENAYKLAHQMSEKLIELNAYNIKPIVIVEPYEGNELIEYKNFIDNDDVEEYLYTFFKELKKRGVTDEMMGMWVPFPEPNTPNWNIKNKDPRDFGLAVNVYLKILKEIFPQAKGSVLLNTTTYKPDDVTWNNGDYLNFSPYIIDIDENLIDSFGIQGFPWIADASKKGEYIFNAEEFLQPFFAIAGAKEMRTKNIWINTGVFRSKYTNDKDKKVQLSIYDRKAIIEDILKQINTLQTFQENAYRISINIFLADKSNTKEATDWSFDKTQEEKQLFREFVYRLNNMGTDISIYDGE